MAQNLNRYNGKLSLQQIVEGINIVMNNARNLYLDAVLLLENGRFPRAASLAILSLEECGKATILRMMALTDNQNEIDTLWKDFSRHHSKNVPAAFVNRLLAGDRSIVEIRSSLNNKPGECHLIDQLKQMGFYVDCDANIHWLIPSEQVNESIARHYVSMAGGMSNLPETTIEDIELLIKHLKPASGQDEEVKKRALVTWLQGQIPSNDFHFIESLFGCSLQE